MYKLYQVNKVEFTKDQLILILDGKRYSFNIEEISTRLMLASKEEREDFIISPSGYGIHWPRIDEDISIHKLMMEINK